LRAEARRRADVSPQTPGVRYDKAASPNVLSARLASGDSRLASSPASGTVTFLFTDVEGSTKLWEAHPQAMRAAMARHDALLHAAIEGSAGTVFKTVGDQFCAAFATAEGALAAAVAAQRALEAEAWDE